MRLGADMVACSEWYCRKGRLDGSACVRMDGAFFAARSFAGLLLGGTTTDRSRDRVAAIMAGDRNPRLRIPALRAERIDPAIAMRS